MARKTTAKKKPAARKTTAKKRPAAKKKTKAKSKEALFVASKVKLQIKADGMNMAGDALEGLNNQIYWLIEQATERASLNGRKTVRSHDFLA